MDQKFEDANKKIHPVESQWHYPIMTKYGFVPNTKQAVGFVRTYEYQHANGNKIHVTTGMQSDYWSHQASKKLGFWNELESYLKKLHENSSRNC